MLRTTPDSLCHYYAVPTHWGLRGLLQRRGVDDVQNSPGNDEMDSARLVDVIVDRTCFYEADVDRATQIASLSGTLPGPHVEKSSYGCAVHTAGLAYNIRYR